jgi:hypothetical protein
MYLGALATIAVLSTILDLARRRPWWHLLASLLAIVAVGVMVVACWSEPTADFFGRWIVLVFVGAGTWLMLSFAQRIGGLLPKMRSGDSPSASAEYVWFLVEALFLAPAVVVGIVLVVRAWR